MCKLCTKIEGLKARGVTAQTKTQLLEVLAALHNQSSYKIGDRVLWELREWSTIRTLLIALPPRHRAVIRLKKAVDVEIDRARSVLSMHHMVHKALSWSDTITPSEAESGRVVRARDWEGEQRTRGAPAPRVERNVRILFPGDEEENVPANFAQWHAKISPIIGKWQTSNDVAILAGVENYEDENVSLLDGTLSRRPELDVPLWKVHSVRTVERLAQQEDEQRRSMRETGRPVGEWMQFCGHRAVGAIPNNQYMYIVRSPSPISDASLDSKILAAVQRQQQHRFPQALPTSPLTCGSLNTQYAVGRTSPSLLAKMKEHGTLSSMLAKIPFRKKFWFKPRTKSIGGGHDSVRNGVSNMRDEDVRRSGRDSMQARGGGEMSDGNSTWTSSSTALSFANYQASENYRERDTGSEFSCRSSALNFGSVFSMETEAALSKDSQPFKPESSYVLPPSQTELDLQATMNPRPFSIHTPRPNQDTRTIFYSTASLEKSDGQVRVQIQTPESRSLSSFSTQSSFISDNNHFKEHVVRRGLFQFSAPTTGPPIELPPLPPYLKTSNPKSFPSPFHAESDCAKHSERLCNERACKSVSSGASSTSGSCASPSFERALAAAPAQSRVRDAMTSTKDRMVKNKSSEKSNSDVSDALRKRRARCSRARGGRVSVPERYQREERANLWVTQQ